MKTASHLWLDKGLSRSKETVRREGARLPPGFNHPSNKIRLFSNAAAHLFNGVLLLWVVQRPAAAISGWEDKERSFWKLNSPPAVYKRHRCERQQFSAGVLHRSSGGKQMRNQQRCS